MSEIKPIYVDGEVWEELKLFIVDMCIDGRISEGWAAAHLQIDRLDLRELVSKRAAIRLVRQEGVRP